MLNYAQLVQLERDLRNRNVLSVYIDGGITDPAARDRWRLDLRHALDAIAFRLEASPHAEREAFSRCRRELEQALVPYQGAIGAPGWAGFFTGESRYAAEALPVNVPTMAEWRSGACVTPYLRVLKEAHPVSVVIVDARKARLYTYALGRLTSPTVLRAHEPVEPPSHMGRPSRQGFHTGTRGRTGTDASQRELQEGTARLLAELRDELVHRAANDGWIVIGGIPEVAAATIRQLPAALAGRAVFTKSLDVHATQAQITESARREASYVRAAFGLERVERVIGEAERFGRGEIGVSDTRRALETGRVQHVYLTSRYIAEHPDDAEVLARLAFDSGAVLEHVSGPAAERLREVGGIAASLRYAVTADYGVAEAAPA